MKSSLVLALALTAPFAAAQNCFNAPPAGTLLGNAQDTIYPPSAIGFAFPLAGTTYTDVSVSDHGLVFLSNAGTPATPVATPFVYTPSLANFGIGNPIIAPMWSDTIGGSLGSGVYISSSATECRIEWRNMTSFGIGNSFSLAMTLFASGNVQFDYGVGVTNNSTFGGVSDNGIAGITTGGTLPAGSDLSLGGSTANNIVFENWVTANTFDMAGNSLLLIPTNPGWTYVLLGSSQCATATDFGSGCGGDPADSIYEAYTSASFDLVGTTLQFLRTGAGYVVLNTAGTFVAPGLGAQAVAPGQLDGQTSFPLPTSMPIAGGLATTVNITTKGNVEFTGPAGFIDFTPSSGELLNWPNTAFHCWHDFDQTASGAITWEVAGGIGYATWNGVESFSSTGLNTVQWQFDLASGNATLVVVAAAGIADPANPDATVVGYSLGGASSDPGQTDLSAIPGGSVIVGDAPAVVGALSMTTNGVPFLGNAAFAYDVTNIPALVPVAFVFFGSASFDPGIPLAGIGAPGCFGHTSADLGALTFPVIGNAGSQGLPIPNTPAFVGASFSAQAVAFSLATPLNLITSNGVTATVGN